ncbi:hypothetical protein LCGC14_1636090 [marine sediment metagenome]|uniref:Uncharacterized protein n=1 Tax=marine sediment metagenome TaxID=412755 RepID=A0A0F9INE5_9ZZZZ
MNVGAQQLCDGCGSPFRPCKCGDDRGRRVGNSTLRVRKPLRARSFTEKYDGTGERYGPDFERVKHLPCELCRLGYVGPGHDRSEGSLELGEQGGPTAHHVGRYDRDGLIPCDGAAHDLMAGLGGRTRQKRFKAWLAANGYDLKALALQYVTQEEGTE